MLNATIMMTFKWSIFNSRLIPLAPSHDHTILLDRQCIHRLIVNATHMGKCEKSYLVDRLFDFLPVTPSLDKLIDAEM